MTRESGHQQAFSDRAIAIALTCTCLFVYSWFFQGRGINQDAHFATIRSLGERGTFDMRPFHERTVDRVDDTVGHTYSNKPPGVPLLGAGPYWALLHVEHWLCAPPPDDDSADRFNQAAMTFLLASVPAALLAAAVYDWLRRDGASQRAAATLTLAFAFGTAVFPFSGMLFNHVIVTASLFGAACLVERDRITWASVLLGVATLCEYMAMPVAVIVIAYAMCIARDREHAMQRALQLSIGPAIAVVVLMIYHAACFGSPFVPAHRYAGDPTAPPRQLWSLPELGRIYWITLHRERGIFYASPVLLLAVISGLRHLGRGWRALLDARRLLCLAIVASYLVFMLFFKTWAGGDGMSMRYAMPVTPFLFVLGWRAFDRVPWVAWIFIAVSLINMFAVTATCANYKGHDDGPPQHWDPIGVGLLNLLRGRLAMDPGAYNIGQLIGLRGLWSVLPAAIVIVGAFVLLRMLPSRIKSLHRLDH